MQRRGSKRRANGQPQWRPLRKGQWSTRRSALARRNNRVMPTQKVIPTQTVVTLLSLPTQEQEALGAEARGIMHQSIGGRRIVAAACTKPEAAGTQPEAAVAAMEKVAGQAEEMPPRQTIGLRGKAAAEVTPFPNEDLAAVPNGAM